MMKESIFKIDNYRNCFYLWDIGQKLTVLDGSITAVNYAANGEDEAYKIPVVNGKAVVPDELLQGTDNLVVWAMVYDGSLYTKASATFGVIARQKPSDYVYTPTEYETFSSKLNKNLGVENAEKVLVVGEDGEIEALELDLSLYATTEELDSAIDALDDSKLDNNLGAANSGKYLRVSNEGNVEAEELVLDDYATKNEIADFITFQDIEDKENNAFYYMTDNPDNYIALPVINTNRFGDYIYVYDKSGKFNNGWQEYISTTLSQEKTTYSIIESILFYADKSYAGTPAGPDLNSVMVGYVLKLYHELKNLNDTGYYTVPLLTPGEFIIVNYKTNCRINIGVRITTTTSGLCYYITVRKWLRDGSYKLSMIYWLIDTDSIVSWTYQPFGESLVSNTDTAHKNCLWKYDDKGVFRFVEDDKVSLSELENYATKDELQNNFNGRKVDAIYKEYNSASSGDIIIGVTLNFIKSDDWFDYMTNTTSASTSTRNILDELITQLGFILNVSSSINVKESNLLTILRKISNNMALLYDANMFYETATDGNEHYMVIKYKNGKEQYMMNVVRVANQYVYLIDFRNDYDTGMIKATYSVSTDSLSNIENVRGVNRKPGATYKDKVLSVNENGYYDFVSLPTPLIVTVTQSNNTYTADKTFAEIFAAIPQREVLCYIGSVYYTLVKASSEEIIFGFLAKEIHITSTEVFVAER